MSLADTERKESASMSLDDVGVADAGALVSPPPRLDALPYLDFEYTHDAELQARVNQILQEEMSTLTRTPDEYLADFLARRPPAASVSFATPLVRSALAAVEAGAPIPSALDLSRYKLDAPSGAAVADASAWRGAIANAQSQLEHQTTRAANLELLKKFGAAAWKTQNEQLTQLNQSLATSLADVQAASEATNRKRKSAQVAAGHELGLLESSYYALAWKNHEIEHACWQLQQRQKTVA